MKLLVCNTLYLSTRMVTPDGVNRQASHMVEFKIKVIAWYKENGENEHEKKCPDSKRFWTLWRRPESLRNVMSSDYTGFTPR